MVSFCNKSPEEGAYACGSPHYGAGWGRRTHPACGLQEVVVTLLPWWPSYHSGHLNACSSAVTLLPCPVLGPQTGHPGIHLSLVALLKAWWTRPLSPHRPMELSISHSSSVTVFPLMWMPEIMLWQASEDCNGNTKSINTIIYSELKDPHSILPPALARNRLLWESIRSRINAK